MAIHCFGKAAIPVQFWMEAQINQHTVLVLSFSDIYSYEKDIDVFGYFWFCWLCVNIPI